MFAKAEQVSCSKLFICSTEQLMIAVISITSFMFIQISSSSLQWNVEMEPLTLVFLETHLNVFEFGWAKQLFAIIWTSLLINTISAVLIPCIITSAWNHPPPQNLSGKLCENDFLCSVCTLAKLDPPKPPPGNIKGTTSASAHFPVT